jgi:hypothetical protein
MSLSLVGLLVLNVLFLLAGSCLLWGVRGWRTWGEYGSLAGVAYICGLAAVCGLGTLVPIFGGSLSAVIILALVAGVAGAGVVLGFLRRRSMPPAAEWPGLPSRPESYVSLGLAILTGAALFEFFLVARIQPLTEWDGWAFWMTKAKAIYYFGGLPAWVFEHAAGPSYPLFIPTLAAMNFRFMGSADTTTLAVQWWLLLAAFVWVAAGLSTRVATPWVVWTFLLSAVCLPELDTRLLGRTADWPLDIFFAIAACALINWIMTQETWLLVPYGLALSAMLLTKREGQLLAACLIVAGIAAGGIRHRRTWASVAGVAAIAYLPSIPWRLWWSSRGLQSDAPTGGWIHSTFGNGGRILPSFHLVLRLLFDFHMWVVVAPVAVVAAVVCLIAAPDRRPAIFFLVTFALGTVGWAWVNWTDPTLPISTNPGLNPTDRAVGSLVLLSVVCGPVLVSQLLAARKPFALPAATPGSVAS